ncbi:non-ribosomal peptide synthetase [Nonomuraea basaltis]|uniref:non-ribosomal peptide synthetase n=1 Tax=Nonomuraea basaltis TaxID=2495887 RepID=UPI00110C48CF|nr:non-ribosomal peptide synthetase [Nonomuraea basaltis]TMR90119.1 amino acid adenylation domain-containing protein [Nonomuraea basaltis]
MTTATAAEVRELAASLRRLGIRLRVEAGNLRMEAPRGAVGPDLLARVRKHKDAIVRILATGESEGVGAQLRSLAEVPRDSWPLSGIQERLFYPQFAEPEMVDYHITGMYRIDWELHMERLENAFRAVIDRHEGFRTRFEWGDGDPIQAVRPKVAFELERAGPGPFHPGELGDFVRPFDLARPPLLRGRLHTVGPDQHVLLIDTHHLVFDAVSWPVFLADLRKAYDGKDLEPLVPAAKEYALWQRDLAAPHMARLGRYWDELLAPAPMSDGTTVPIHPSLELGAGDVRSVRRALDADLVASVRRFCRENALTPSMFYMAAYTLALQDLGGRAEAVIGFPVDVRADAGLSSVIGPLVNTVLIRTAAGGAHTVRHYMERIRSQVTSALEHSHYPYDAMIEHAAARRNVREEPVVDGFFNYTGIGARQASDGLFVPVAPGTAAVLPLLPCLSSRYAATLIVVEEPGQARIEVERDSTQIDEQTCRHLVDKVASLITGLIDDVDRPLGRLSAGLAVVTGATTLPEPGSRSPAKGGPMPSRSLIDLFTETVARCGQLPAVTDRSATLTFAQLDELSDAVAAWLSAHGVDPGDAVAFQIDRRAGLFAVLLGILKAGAAYVAVDPRYPRARRDAMIASARVKALVIEESADDLGDPGTTVLRFGAEPAPEGAGEAPASRPDAGDLACILFTSGSSGEPKAVALEHGNLVFFAENPSLPALGSHDRVGHVSNVSFDAFHYETWCAFAAGAEIVILEPLPVLLNQDIRRALRRHRITVMLVPSMALNHVVREDREAFNDLRVLCTGGDVVLSETCAQLSEGGFRGEFWNLYGPTEATTACVGHRVTEEDGRSDSVPIGRPFEGVSVRILDESGAELPPGEIGVLHVGGPGVARGYLDAGPGGPFTSGEEDEDRCYATGDRVCRREDGILEFHGRADSQVKIRGYRVEPAEVERTLTGCEGVHAAAVVPVGMGQDRLLAAVVVADATVRPQALRGYAAAELPEFMVPAVVVRVDALPISEHGKRDADAIAALAATAARRSAARVPPGDDVERYLADLWEDLLLVEGPGVEDDFFALGGNSLLAFRMMRRLKDRFGVTLDARTILGQSTLGGLAALVRDAMAA